MTKKKAVMWIVVFLIIIISPPVIYFFLGRYVDAENYENRNAALKPTLSIDNYSVFSKEYEEYYNDAIPFRNQLITLSNSIDYYLFGQSSNDKVIIGKEGWLLYCNKEDFNPLEQSLGYWKFSDEQLKCIADNLESTRRVLESQGIEFVLFIAPNKETIYADKVPDYYDVADSYTSTDQLIDYLKENTNIRLVYPKDKLEEIKRGKEDFLLYHKLDTHWNYAGAYVGAVSLTNELGIKMPLLSEVYQGPVYSSTGDLANMLNIKIKNGDVDYILDDALIGIPECEKSDFSAEFSFHMSGADPRRLFVRRDSFSSAMMSFVASQFEDSLFMHYMSFSQQQIFDYEADIFVLESAERYLSSLENFRISFVEFSIDEEEEDKTIFITPAVFCDYSPYVSVFVKKEGTEEAASYQVMKPLEDEIKIQVPGNEKGEIYVYVFESDSNDAVLEELTIQY